MFIIYNDGLSDCLLNDVPSTYDNSTREKKWSLDPKGSSR